MGQEISRIDESNQDSVINMVPPGVAEKILAHALECKELFEMDEHTLSKYLRDTGRHPTVTDYRLRMKFWMEYDSVMDAGKKLMRMEHVVAGVCHKSYFYGQYLSNKYKCAWLLCPPATYQVKAQEALAFGLEQLRDILEQPHTLANGKTDARLGELKAKIVAMLDVRVNGAVVQKTLSLNVNSTPGQLKKEREGASMEDLQRELKELEQRERHVDRLAHLPDAVIDVDE